MYEKLDTDKLPQYNTVDNNKIESLEKSIRNFKRCCIFGMGLLGFSVLYIMGYMSPTQDITNPNNKCNNNEKLLYINNDFVDEWNKDCLEDCNLPNESNEDIVQMDTCWVINGDMNLANLLCKSQFSESWYATELLPCEYGNHIVCAEK